jgi:hypothetical protein
MFFMAESPTWMKYYVLISYFSCIWQGNPLVAEENHERAATMNDCGIELAGTLAINIIIIKHCSDVDK